MIELSSSSLLRIMWGVVATTGHDTEKLFCSNCVADKDEFIELKRKGNHLRCVECRASTHMGNSDQQAVLSMYARIQPPSLEEFKSWATTMSSQDAATGGSWSLKIPKVSSSSSSTSDKGCSYPTKCSSLSCSKTLTVVSLVLQH